MTSYSKRRGSLRLAVATAALLLAAQAAGAAEASRSEQRTLAARQLAMLIVENPVGGLELRGGEARELGLEAQFRVEGSSTAAVKRVIEALRIETFEQDGRLRVRPVHGDRVLDSPRPSWLDGARVRVDLRLRVPAGLPVAASVTRDKLTVVGLDEDVVLAATSGEVAVRELKGDLELGVTSARVRVEQVAGDVNVTATSGDLDLRRVGGDATLNTITGKVRVEDVDGDLEVESGGGTLTLLGVRGRQDVISASGDVAIRDPGGDIKVNCANGDLSVFGLGSADEGNDVFLASSSGDVEILLLPEASFHLDLATDLGTMQLRLPLAVEDVSRRHVAGTLADGKGRLQIVTATGDIRITLDANSGRD